MSRTFWVRCKNESDAILCQMKLLVESRWEEKEVEVKRLTDEIKYKCYIDIRGIYTTCGSLTKLLELF